jgi:capsular exopolysaccharide synthesis family protein
LDAEIGDAEGQIAVLTEQEKHWAKTVAELTREKELGGESDFKMLAAARDAEEEEKVVKAITGEIRTLEIDLMAPQRAKVLDEAVVTKAIEGKKRIFITAGAGAAALGLILLGVAWWEFQKRKITSTEEIIHGFGVSLVGTLPVIPWKKRRRIDAASADPAAYGAWNESIDSYRIMLLRQAAGRTVRVVMVTSAMPGEGKSSLSGHLAVSLARGGFRTVLVDTDLRNPTVHRLFGLPRKPGLGEVLNGTIDLPAAVQDTAVPRLSVISAGDLDLTAALCLGQDDLAPLFGRLREGFDFVVIDSPPILPVAGTLHVAACADGVIVSLLRNVSRMPKVAAAVHRLRIMGVPILGAVVNGSDEDVYSSRYHVLASPEEE